MASKEEKNVFHKSVADLGGVLWVLKHPPPLKNFTMSKVEAIGSFLKL